MKLKQAVKLADELYTLDPTGFEQMNHLIMGFAELGKLKQSAFLPTLFLLIEESLGDEFPGLSVATSAWREGLKRHIKQESSRDAEPGTIPKNRDLKRVVELLTKLWGDDSRTLRDLMGLVCGATEMHEVAYPDDLRHVRDKLACIQSGFGEEMPELGQDAVELIDRIHRYLEEPEEEPDAELIDCP